MHTPACATGGKSVQDLPQSVRRVRRAAILPTLCGFGMLDAALLISLSLRRFFLLRQDICRFHRFLFKKSTLLSPRFVISATQYQHHRWSTSQHNHLTACHHRLIISTASAFTATSRSLSSFGSLRTAAVATPWFSLCRVSVKSA